MDPLKGLLGLSDVFFLNNKGTDSIQKYTQPMWYTAKITLMKLTWTTIVLIQNGSNLGTTGMTI